MHMYDLRNPDIVAAKREIHRWLNIQLAPADGNGAAHPELRLDPTCGGAERLRLVESALDTNPILQAAARRLALIEQLRLNLELVGGAVSASSRAIHHIGPNAALTLCSALRRGRPR